MLINPEYTEKVEKRYEELVKENLTEGFLDEELLGKLKIFINNKPSMTLNTYTIGNDTVYVGSND